MFVKVTSWPVIFVVLFVSAHAHKKDTKEEKSSPKGVKNVEEKEANEEKIEKHLKENLSKLAMKPDELGEEQYQDKAPEYGQQMEEDYPELALSQENEMPQEDPYNYESEQQQMEMPFEQPQEDESDFNENTLPFDMPKRDYNEQMEPEMYPNRDSENTHPDEYGYDKEMPMAPETIEYPMEGQGEYPVSQDGGYESESEEMPPMALYPPVEYDHGEYPEGEYPDEGQQGQFEEAPLDQPQVQETPDVQGGPFDELYPSEEMVETTTKSAAKRHEEMKRKTEEVKRHGQMEFVDFYDKSFVVPAMQKVARHEVTVKRAPTLQFDGAGLDAGPMTASKIVLMGVGLVASVLVVGGVVAGAVVFKRNQLDSPNGSEPCGIDRRVVGRKGTRPRGGDAEMAYDAHLHHYAQTKQKIIDMQAAAGSVPSASAVGVLAADEMQAAGASDSEDEGEVDPGDCSVYECPGLAPTGDIEVANPMFDNGKNGKH